MVQLMWLWTHSAILTPNHYSGNYTGYQYAREFRSKWLSWPVRHTQPAHPQHLHQRIATYSTRSSSLPLLTVPNPSTVFARRAFNYTAPTTWNSLAADILTYDSEFGFKRLLKTHLFNNCFNVAWLTHSQHLCSSAYGALQICLWYDMMIHYHWVTMVKFGVRVRAWNYLPHAKFGKNCLRGYSLLGKIYTKN